MNWQPLDANSSTEIAHLINCLVNSATTRNPVTGTFLNSLCKVAAISLNLGKKKDFRHKCKILSCTGNFFPHRMISIEGQVS
jgi:hypothetical protein